MMGVDVELVILNFLKHSSSQDADYNLALRILEDELQCNDLDGDLETDGNTPVPRKIDVSEVDDELCRQIGAQLAELGDRFEREGMIKKEVVESIVQDLLNESLSEKRFSDLIKSVLLNIPPGIEQEKATVAIALTLTKEVGCAVPNLLQNLFHYTSQFIRGNYLAYLQQFGRQAINEGEHGACCERKQ
uniref:BH3-interacting domain death agonist n=1 Tax=Leptobrachium leishanense TaxID=445787 RepID=A0A8C5PIH2_9ANUR